MYAPYLLVFRIFIILSKQYFVVQKRTVLESRKEDGSIHEDFGGHNQPKDIQDGELGGQRGQQVNVLNRYKNTLQVFENAQHSPVLDVVIMVYDEDGHR
jgi:hypothetical protein